MLQGLNSAPEGDHPSETSAPEPPADGVPAFRCLLKIETERLRTRHRFGRSGRDVAAARSDLVDVVVARACAAAAAECAPGLPAEQDEIAVVALGGYGRRELAPFSDIDLLFLRADGADDDVRALVTRALALLWDSGLTVGHSFRTVAECVSIARSDLHSRTALAEARLLAGSPRLFARLVERLDALVFASARATESFLESLRLDLEDRYARYGRAVGLQEPHVKESAGGLRDLHAVLWVGHALFGARGLTALHERGGIGEGERKAALQAYDHLCRVRNEAHFATGRKSDLLTLDLQPTVAANLGYRSRTGRLASEVFMREYHQRASELFRFSRAFVLRHAAPPRKLFALSLLRRRPRGTFEIRDGQLYSRGPAGGHASARRLLEAFAIAQGEGPELSEELKLEIRGSLRLVDRAFRESREAGRALLRLLDRRGRVGTTLRRMHETGLLGRLMPEFARITFLVQHDFYHRYTVDEHTLTALEALDALLLAQGDPGTARLRKVLEEVAHPAVLHLGLLLHDIGKGWGSGHSRRGARIARRVCTRLGLEPTRVEDVVFLVDAHLEMSQLSQRRDLSDPGLVESFARRVGTVDRLDMLMLLTYADHCGVGPGVWTEWKGTLLWDLYTRARACLLPAAQGEEDLPSTGRERAVEQLREEFAASEVERHFALMPERYLRSTDGADMVRHFRLLQGRGARTLAAEWRPVPHATDLVVATPDHPGLFAALAGTLTAQGLDILSVDLYTREDGVALDVFKARDVHDKGPVPEARWPAVEAALSSAVVGGHDVAAAVEKRRRGAPRRPRRRPLVRPRVSFDPLASATSTVIEVRAEDEPGLAYRIASVLSAHGLDIVFAKVATEKSHALDVFYVTGASGGKLEAEEGARVEAALISELDPRREAAASSRERGNG